MLGARLPATGSSGGFRSRSRDRLVAAGMCLVRNDRWRVSNWGMKLRFVSSYKENVQFHIKRVLKFNEIK